jgi:mRNA interferase MazF
MTGKKFDIMLKRLDIILIPFPFTDLLSSKVRPAVIVSADPQGDDLIVAFISSVVPEVFDKGDVLIANTHPEFPLTGLKRSSVVKVRKLLTISKALALRKLGHFPPALIFSLDSRLKTVLNLE